MLIQRKSGFSNFMIRLSISLMDIFHIMTVRMRTLSWAIISHSCYELSNIKTSNLYWILNLILLCIIIFTRRFLNTKSNSPILDRALIWMIVIRSAWFFVELFFLPQTLTYRNVEIIPFSLIFYTGIYVWRRGYRPARFFVIGYGVL